ncbi:hypothetical protein AB0I28_12710 [Phytomonospora sp. NPDC050363]|uniref:hypothetical protein n=1 Tax=Phytomonospora sp. NPDC050363 TaxID=3155642 RepID=UPI0033E9DF76
MEYLVMLTGAETYTRLDADMKASFDMEWGQALKVAEGDMDLEPLMLHVCRYWTGGSEAVEATRSEYTAMTGTLTAGTVMDALAGEKSGREWEFANAWRVECWEARESRDWNGLWCLVGAWHRELNTTLEEAAEIAALTETVEAAIGEGRLEVLYEQGVLVKGM